VDSIQCLTIAIENPPDPGEYRVFNQLDEIYSINEIAEKVRAVADQLGITTNVRQVENPRIEMEEHFYKVRHDSLRQLGFRPTRNILEELKIMLSDILRFKSRLLAKRHVIAPTVRWNGSVSKPLVDRTHGRREVIAQEVIRVSSE